MAQFHFLYTHFGVSWFRGFVVAIYEFDDICNVPAHFLVFVPAWESLRHRGGLFFVVGFCRGNYGLLVCRV